MTGLTLPASTAAALPGKVAAPSLLAIGTPADAAPGVPNLAAFIDLMMGKIVTPGDEKGGDERQDDAATGNGLPEKAEDKGDPALAWLMAVAPIVFPSADPAKPVTAKGGSTLPTVTADGAAPALPAAAASPPQLVAGSDVPQLPAAKMSPRAAVRAHTICGHRHDRSERVGALVLCNPRPPL